MATKTENLGLTLPAGNDPVQVADLNGNFQSIDKVLKPGGSVNALALGGKAPEYYLQPRNLLDNSDFRNPVNQRGQVSYTAKGYTIDRWETRSEQTITVNDGYISITNLAASGRTSFEQRTSVNLAGKTVTAAVCDRDGNIYCASAVAPSKPAGAETIYFAAADFDGHTARLGVSTNYYWYHIMTKNGGTCNLKWAALYEGEYTADTLPPYVPKGYAAELAECQRRYIQFEHIGAIGHVTSSAKNYHIFIPLPIQMALVPSVVDSFTIIARLGTGSYSNLTPNATALTLTSGTVTTRRGNDQNMVHLTYSVETAVDANNTIIEYEIDKLKLTADI